MPSKPSFEEQSTERLVSFPSVRDLIAERQVRVALQPIVGVEDGRVLAHEALVRIAVPQFRSPRALFEAAVESGCCGELGRAIREAAIEAAPQDSLFLNIHPHELHERWLLELDDPIYRHPHDVYLEITESVPLTHFRVCQDVLRQIREHDIRLVIDDLGAGYSNLRYIADLNPDLVKLDRALVTGLSRNRRRQRLVASIVALSENLGAQVVAEGIESLDELLAVRDAGVHYVQGFLLARPSLPPAEVSWPLSSELPPSDPAGPVSGEIKIPTLPPVSSETGRRISHVEALSPQGRTKKTADE